MNELCSYYRPQLPLYAENELRDDYHLERIRVHVMCCSECQEWLEDYEDLTSKILEDSCLPLNAEIQQKELNEGDREFIRQDDEFLFNYYQRDWISEERSLTDQIMMEVDRLAGQRKRSPLKYLVAAAAAVLVITALSMRLFIVNTPSPNEMVGMIPAQEVIQASVIKDNGSLANQGQQWIHWVLDGKSGTYYPNSGSPGEVQLLGVVYKSPREDLGEPLLSGRNREEARVQWVFNVRLEEMFCDPLGGGWTFLVPVENPHGENLSENVNRMFASSPSRLPAVQASNLPRPIPVRRLHIEKYGKGYELNPISWSRNFVGNISGYRLVVVPDSIIEMVEDFDPDVVGFGKKLENGFAGHFSIHSLKESFDETMSFDESLKSGKLIRPGNANYPKY